MLKFFHILFVFGSLASFTGRVALSQFKPEVLQAKLLKVAPHVIDTLLLLSGIILVFQGNWLEGNYGWITSKFILLLFYVFFGVITMRSTGGKRWMAFAAAIGCFALIFTIAISKQGFV
ncbi:SirB2 family protein [Methylomarinum vadi]|uniref:SirB2 family protein n=1 Tax=Methylomarinum vadi TaxID=438855 RepID=UPI0004DF3C91|nr:SirB2 family protein [Methylomarinum vadi]